MEINQQEASQRIMKLEAKLSEQQKQYQSQINELHEQLEAIPEERTKMIEEVKKNTKEEINAEDKHMSASELRYLLQGIASTTIKKISLCKYQCI